MLMLSSMYKNAQLLYISGLDENNENIRHRNPVALVSFSAGGRMYHFSYPLHERNTSSEFVSMSSRTAL